MGCAIDELVNPKYSIARVGTGDDKSDGMMKLGIRGEKPLPGLAEDGMDSVCIEAGSLFYSSFLNVRGSCCSYLVHNMCDFLRGVLHY